MNEVDLSPIIVVGLQAIAGVLGVLGIWAVRKLTKKLGLEADEKIRGYLETAINNGLNMGMVAAANKIKGADFARVEVQNEAIREAQRYVVATTPDALKHFKLDPDKLGVLLASRLASKLNVAMPGQPPALPSPDPSVPVPGTDKP